MTPEAVPAIARLQGAGHVAPADADRMVRAADGRLVSVRLALRALLYAGVVILLGGVGLLVQENYGRIGPVAIAVSLALAAALCFAWVTRARAPFGWDEVPSPNLAFDYVLLLGVLLAAADLAYVEVQFTALGAHWPWHLLIVAVGSGLLGVRYDSRVLFSFALTSLAAWRGVSIAQVDWMLDGPGGDIYALNAIGCGIVFLLLAELLEWLGRKAHFGPVATTMGWLLILGGLTAGMTSVREHRLVYAPALILVGLALAAWEVGGAYWLFALGILGAYVGLNGLVLEWIPGFQATLAWFVLSASILIAGLIALGARRRPSA